MNKKSTPSAGLPGRAPGPGSRAELPQVLAKPRGQRSRLTPGPLLLARFRPHHEPALPSTRLLLTLPPRPGRHLPSPGKGTDNTSSVAHVHFARVLQDAKLPGSPSSPATTGLGVFAQADLWLGYRPSPPPSPGKLLHTLHYSAQRMPSPGSLP